MSLNIKETILAIINEDDADKRIRLIRAVLAEDPANPIARYLEWRHIREDQTSPDNPEKDIQLLREIAAALSDTVRKPENEDIPYDVYQYQIYLDILSELCCALYFNNKKAEAFPFAQELMDIDNEGYLSGRLIYYPCLIQKKEYEKTIADADADEFNTLTGAYCRALALFELGRHHEAVLEILDAINSEPEMIFYIIGGKEFPQDIPDELESEDDCDDDFIMQLLIISNIWCGDDGEELDKKRYSFIEEIALLFGYFTKRLDDEDVAMLEDAYEEGSAILDELNAYKAKKIPDGWENEEALAKIKELSEKGLLGSSFADED